MKKAKKNDILTNGVIYARYSEGPNQTDASIEGQVRECKEFAKRNGIKIVNVYSDAKHTGRNDNRIEFQKMLRDSKQGFFNVVIVWKVDRFGRNRAEIAQNKAILKQNGVKVSSAKENIPDSPEGIILESVLEGLAEYYSANLAQNIKRGMTENALQCKSNGSGKSLGYIVDDDQHFKIEPNEAEIVKLIFMKYDQGFKIADILRYLTNNNIKTKRGKDFTHEGIGRILMNRNYIGEYKYSDIIVPGGMPQIIDEELFNRVQRRREREKRTPAARRSNSNVDFLLTGKLFCGNCKGTMRGYSGTSKTNRMYYYYACHNKISKHIGCKKKNVKKEWLETEVTKITLEYILKDDIIDFISDKVVEIQKTEHDDKTMLKYYQKQLTEVQSSLNNILKAIEAGIITSSTKSRLEELENERTILEAEIEREKIVYPIIEKEQVIFFLEQFKNGNITDKEYQRSVIDTFVNKVILYDDKITITYNISNNKNEVTADIIETASNSAESAESAEKKPKPQEFVLTPVASTKIITVRTREGNVYVLPYVFVLCAEVE